MKLAVFGVMALLAGPANAQIAPSVGTAPATLRGDGPPPPARPFHITRVDAALDAIIAPDARLELLGDRFGITEGPVWVPSPSGGFVLVSDLTTNTIYKIAPDHSVSVFVDKAGYSGDDMDHAGMHSRSGRVHVLMIGPSCTAIDGAGRLLWCAGNDGAIMRLEKDGQRSVVAGSVDGKRFNGPNDLVLLKSGAMFFTDPDFGLRGGRTDPLKQLKTASVWYWQDGHAVAVLDEAQLGGPPDGIALSPDERFLYLTAGPGKLKRYRVGASGALSDGSMLAEGPDIGDGLKTDLRGNIYAASGGSPAVGIRAPSGELLGTLDLPISDAEPKRQICASNLAFGGADGRTLIIAACQAVYQIRLLAPGPVAHQPVPGSRRLLMK
jgi:gluconolactonase